MIDRSDGLQDKIVLSCKKIPDQPYCTLSFLLFNNIHFLLVKINIKYIMQWKHTQSIFRKVAVGISRLDLHMMR